MNSAMRAAIEDFLDEDLMPFAEATQEMIADIRRRFGSNDVVVIVHVNEEGDGEVHAGLRSGVIRLVEEAMPDAVTTIARLNRVPPPDRFMLMIWKDEKVFILNIPVPEGTEGVMN